MSVLIIALYHFWQQSWLELSVTVGGRRFTLLPMMRVGYLFVDVLLLLSAFLLYLPYASARFSQKQPPTLKQFYQKRALRILPGYLLGILLPLFVLAIPAHKYSGVMDLLSDLVPYLTFTQTFFPKVYQASRLNSVLWTVGIEVQAYLIFPLAAKAFDKKPGSTYLVMVLMGLLYRYGIWRILPDLTLWVNQLPSFVDVYANGMLAAWLYVRWRERPPTTWERVVCTLGSCAAMFGIWRLVCVQSGMSWEMKGLHEGQALLRFPLTALAAAWLLLTERSFKGFKLVFGNVVTRWVAGVSYAFYIWHQLLAVKLRMDWRFPPYLAAENPQFAGERPWQWLYMITCFVVGLLAAAVVTYGWERPITRLLTRRNENVR